MYLNNTVSSLPALQPYGWSDAWHASWLASEHAQDPARSPGRIVVEEKGGYFVHTLHGERLAQLAGRYRGAIEQGAAERPVVGDWVALTAEPGHASAIIHATLPRRTRLARMSGGGRKSRLGTAYEQVIAANVDVLFLVTALSGDLNPRRLERYLAIAWDSGAQPVVLLTKADLCPDVPAALASIEPVTGGAPVHVVSPKTGEGLTALETYLGGRTLALIGSSGVGKTTLINRWLGGERLATGHVSATGEGRHTTTRRQLLAMPSGGAVIDTPGMRELALWEADAGLTEAFADVDALIGQCKFGDCAHGSEPGCALRAAVANGTLPAERLESWLKLQGELAHVRGLDDPAAQRESKRRGKIGSKLLRARIADKRPGEP
ncbi:MAG TPA: ribosome small subunit-dependent GTPase A [bacterium]